MRWTIRHPNVPLSTLDQPAAGRPALLSRWDRIRLRRAALRYAAHGWPVTPGACLAGQRFACGRPGCPTTACHPAIESWEDAASTDAGQVSSWWRRRPHAVLLATGHRFDALEVPAALGLRALGAARLHADVLGADPIPVPGPVVVTAGRQWMFLVRPGSPLRPELDRRPDVVRHGRGSWIPAAPSRTLEGAVRWAVSPVEAGWQLPGADVVQQLLVDALPDSERTAADGSEWIAAHGDERIAAHGDERIAGADDERIAGAGSEPVG